MTEDQFYQIWNRACTDNGGSDPLEGDVALTSMLLGHGYVMNGGLVHFEDLSQEQQRESIAGYRFFSFNEAADILVKLPDLSEVELHAARIAFVEIDAGMVNKVRKYIEANPHRFHKQ